MSKRTKKKKDAALILSLSFPITHMNPLCGLSTVCTKAASRLTPARGACATSEASASEGEKESIVDENRKKRRRCWKKTLAAQRASEARLGSFSSPERRAWPRCTRYGEGKT